MKPQPKRYRRDQARTRSAKRRAAKRAEAFKRLNREWREDPSAEAGDDQ